MNFDKNSIRVRERCNDSPIIMQQLFIVYSIHVHEALKNYSMTIRNYSMDTPEFAYSYLTFIQ